MNGPVLRTMLCAAGLTTVVLKATTVGRFENSGDVGIPPKPGKVEFDAVRGEYRITGGGAKCGPLPAPFSSCGKTLSGDITLTAMSSAPAPALCRIVRPG